MEQKSDITDNLIENWNEYFPHYQLKTADLKSAQRLMGAVFEIFHKLGIDADVIVNPSDECVNDHTVYYQDLIPVLNMTRVINHLVRGMPAMTTPIYIGHILQPIPKRSRAILLLLFNLLVFQDHQMNEVAMFEEELFSKAEQLRALEDKKNHLLNIMNEQAAEKGRRTERLEKINHEIKVFENELHQENESLKDEKEKYNIALKAHNQMELVYEQKKTNLESLLAEVEKKRALIVHDEEDVRSQLAKALKNQEEMVEKTKSLSATLMEKENCVKNLQTTKANLDSAYTELDEIMKLTESLNDQENDDFGGDAEEGELCVLKAEISDLEAQFAELKATREEINARRQDTMSARLQVKNQLKSDVHNAKKKEKKCQEVYKRVTKDIVEMKELSKKAEQAKDEYYKNIRTVKHEFEESLKAMNEAVIDQILRAEKRITAQIMNRANNDK
ncbi:keratin, type II cytoskeletal 4-like [Leptidea sinapis]|nr:keratin, type II cytoskeletal 4-like [Leptidea sinapis]